MKRLALLLTFFVVAACGDDGTGESGGDTFTERSPADALAEAEAASDGKSDEPAACGEDSCARNLCGYDCSNTGQQCERACATEPTRENTLVKFKVSGAENADMDSQQIGYNPALRLDDVLIYGCELWDFSNQEKDGLEVKFNEVIEGAFAVGDPETIGNKAWVYAAPYEGPGSYVAEGYFKASGDSEVSYFGKESCGMEVDAMADGGIKGTVTCDAIPARGEASGTIKMTGDFQCGVDSMDLLFTDLTP